MVEVLNVFFGEQSKVGQSTPKSSMEWPAGLLGNGQGFFAV